VFSHHCSLCDFHKAYLSPEVVTWLCMKTESCEFDRVINRPAKAFERYVDFNLRSV